MNGTGRYSARTINRRHLLRGAVAASAAVGLTPLLAACASPSATPASPASTVGPTSTAAGAARQTAANIVLPIAPVGFSPLFGSHSGNRIVMGLIFPSIVRFDERMEIVPDLAEKWDVSPNADQVTFHLRQGVKWTDGAPLTAEDISFTLHLLLSKESGSAHVARLNSIKGAAEYTAGTASQVSGIEVVNPTTLRLTLAAPNAPFLIQLAEGTFILPKHVLADVALTDLAKHTFFQAPTVGAAGYRFKTWASGQYIEVEANPEFYRGRPKVDRIFAKLLTGEVALTQLEAGELDIAAISPLDAARFEGMSDRKVYNAPGVGITQMAVNTVKPYLSDKRVRQALVHALDREGIVKAVLAGHASVTDTPFPGLSWALPSDLKKYSYDPERARALLREAGWDSGRTLVLSWTQGLKDRDGAVPIIQSQLGAVGVKVDLNPVASAVLAELYRSKEHDLVLFGGGRYGVDPDFAINYYSSQGGATLLTNYSNSRVDELFIAGRSTSDRAGRATAYQELARILVDEMPTVFLYVPDSYYATHERVSGFKPSRDANVYGYWNADEWAVAE